MTTLRDAAMNSKAWPFEEARRVLKRYEKRDPEKGYVLFETGYGPSGLPHIGTFGEVARTTMVRRAFEMISDIPTRLFCFSDDMDGMRKVPDNVPNADMLRQHLQLLLHNLQLQQHLHQLLTPMVRRRSNKTQLLTNMLVSL